MKDILSSSDKTAQSFGLTMQHSNEFKSSEPLHKWNFTMEVTSSTKTNWFAIDGKMERNSKTDTNDWKVSFN